MAIAVDTTRGLRRPADLRALVEAIVEALPEDEAHWVEWKAGSLRLDAAEGWFSISKQILGFANRQPERAARFMQGIGYVVVGAAPDNLSGVEPVDVAKLDDWLRAYLGDDGPSWSPIYISVGPVQVLVILVEAPKWGDRIYSLRRTYQPPSRGQGADKGTIFVRREAKTERANDVEIDMLQERLLRGAQEHPLDIDLQWLAEPLAITPLDVSFEARQEWLEASRRLLLKSLDEPVQSRARQRALSSEYERIMREMRGEELIEERRTPDEYRSQVASYLEDAASALATVAAHKLAESELNLVRLEG
jgi:hypothetical protein